MDSENHFKKKSQMSKGNFFRKACLALLLVSIIFSGWSCEKEKENDVKIKLSEDICTLCAQSPVHTLNDGVSIVTSKIHTPNGDGYNDFFGIRVINTSGGSFSISEKSIIFFDRDNMQIASFSQFDECCIWDGRVNEKFVESGLYSYKLTINGIEMEGNFIVVNGNDKYVDVCLFNTECGKNCLVIDSDPALFTGSCEMQDNIETFSNLPAIVVFDNKLLKPVLMTSLGIFYAQEIQTAYNSHEITVGNALLTNFSVNYGQQISSEYLTVSNLQWIPIGKTIAQGTPEGESLAGIFNTPIEDMEVIYYIRYSKNKGVLFCIFTHTVPAEQVIDYEMTYNQDNTADYQISIRAKQVGESSKPSTTNVTLYAFDISDFITTHKYSDKIVRINFRYKTGVDGEGNDIYQNYKNVIELNIE